VEDDNMKKLRAFLLKTNMRFSNLVNNQKGSQTLEWIGIAAVVVIVVGLISTAFSSNTEFGTTVLDKFKGWIEKNGRGIIFGAKESSIQKTHSTNITNNRSSIGWL
jgi:hypothetical protein